MYSIRQEGEENTPYYCKKLKIVKSSSVSETKIAFRNTADKLFEKLIIDDGVKAICETPKPYVKEIEGVGNATFAATGDSEQRGPEPTYGSWGSLEYVESIKNVTIEGARQDDKEVEFSSLRNVPADTITEHIPGADFSFRRDPKISPIAINIIAEGSVIITAKASPAILRS
jgi:hypothetical protein